MKKNTKGGAGIRTTLLTLVVLFALVVLGAAGGAAFVYFGVYNVAATDNHTAPVYWLLDIAMRRSVKQRAEGIEVPALDDQALIERGFRLYRGECEQCHGGPGVAPEAIALGMTPLPANLVHTAREWQPAELFWVVKHGIKMAGMPAWEFRLPEKDLWAIVAFVRQLPTMAPLEYKAAAMKLKEVPAEAVSSPPGPLIESGKPERGKAAIQQYACATCHKIPGIVGANAPVGPTLEGIAARQFIAGVLPNTHENMVRWLMAPLEVDPRSAMPDLRVTARDANDIAAYLDTLE
ncbi:MAG: c-type cytochrome [Burkholderiales bacterium]